MRGGFPSLTCLLPWFRVLGSRQRSRPLHTFNDRNALTFRYLDKKAQQFIKILDSMPGWEREKKGRSTKKRDQKKKGMYDTTKKRYVDYYKKKVCMILQNRARGNKHYNLFAWKTKWNQNSRREQNNRGSSTHKLGVGRPGPHAGHHAETGRCCWPVLLPPKQQDSGSDTRSRLDAKNPAGIWPGTTTLVGRSEKKTTRKKSKINKKWKQKK